MKPFYFAWTAPAETAFGPEHHVEDEKVFSFKLTQHEGEFPALEVELKNPRVGLLKAGRPVWAWFSWDRGLASGGAAGVDVVPLFRGRLVGVPENLQDELVRLSFVARPTDYAEQKAALAEAMRVAPYWDPLFLTPDQREVDDSVLEARTQLWHVDRVTHLLTASDIVTGEDGVLEFGASVGQRVLLYDDMNLTFGEPPLRKVQVSAELSWNQGGAGDVDVTPAIRAAFQAAGSGPYVFESYTGDGLVKDWPKAGAGIGSGWTVGAASAALFGLQAQPTFFFMSKSKSTVFAIGGGGYPSGLAISLRPAQGTFLGQDSSRIVVFPKYRLTGTVSLSFKASRSRVELVEFELNADTQAILTEVADAEVLRIALSTSFVGSDLDPESGTGHDGSAIGDIRLAHYLPTERGRRSLTYLIALARAKLLSRARTARLSFRTSFPDAVDLTCRHNALVADGRLPGGQVAGKVVSYELSIDGSVGEPVATVEIAASIGKGSTVTEEAGEPVYAEEGYVDPGYQFYDGATIMPFAGEVTYSDFTGPDEDDYDGVDLLDMRHGTVLRSCEVEDGPDAQEAHIASEVLLPGRPWQDPAEAAAALRSRPTKVRLDLVPLEGGPFTARYAITVSALSVPKTIDLEAA